MPIRDWIPIFAVLALLPLNYALEVHKWRRLFPANRIPGTPLAWRAVLHGHAFGLVTPNRWGDYLGRFLTVPKSLRQAAAWATLASRWAQAVATLCVGLLVLPLTTDQLTGLSPKWIWVLGGCVGGAVLLFLWRPAWPLALLFALLRRTPFRFSKALAAPKFSSAQLYGALWFSALRYAVFFLQLLLLLAAFGVDSSSAQALQFVGLLFLLKSLIPSVAFAELGIREALALHLAGLLALPPVAAVGASLLLFGINLGLPAIVGALSWAAYRRPA